MHTLLIDEDPTVVFITERLFQREGMTERITSFQSPAEGVAYLREQALAGTPPRVVLLDLNMPLPSGWDVLEAVKPLGALWLNRCAVYVLTSSLVLADTVRAQMHPLVVKFLSKPLHQNHIKAIQAQVWGKRMA